MTPNQRLLAEANSTIELLNGMIVERDARIKELEDALLPPVALPDFLCLTRSQEKIAKLIYARSPRHVSDGLICQVLYGEEDGQHAGVIRVLVTQLRAKLKPHGIEIERRFGRGFIMPAGATATLRGMIECDA